jgi:hypothetical protein
MPSRLHKRQTESVYLAKLILLSGKIAVEFVKLVVVF